MKHNYLMIRKYYPATQLLGIALLLCSFAHSSRAQTWTPDATIFSFWSQDPGNNPGTTNQQWPIYNNAAAQYNTAYLASQPPALTKPAVNPGIDLAYVGTNQATTHQIHGINTCTLSDAVANNSYLKTTIVLRPASTTVKTLRIRQFVFSTLNDPFNGGSTFQLSLALVDLTANGPMQYVFTGYNAALPASTPASLTHTLTPTTPGINWANVNIIPGHTYEIRYYFNGIPGSCFTGAQRNFDNPHIYTEKADPVTLSGTVYNDIDGASNGINNLNWASLPGMKAILVDGSGNVAAITPVDGFGAYSFTGIDPVNTFKVMLSTANPAIGTQAPATATLPAGWVSTGENIGTGTGNDGTPNGVSTPFSPTGNTVVNFGIEQPPVANPDNLSGQAAGSPATVLNVLANDTDPGSTLNPDSVSLVLPQGTAVTGVTIDAQGDITGFTVPGQGSWSLNSSNANVTFTPAPGFTGTPSPVQYIVTDAAGQNSNPATISITYNPPATISGNIFNDNNGATGGVDGTAVGGPASASGQLYVNLVDYATGIVVSSAAVNANGQYSLPTNGTGNYKVQINTTAGVPGSNAPARDLPAGWYPVSEFDNWPDIAQQVAVGATNITGINFGINQPPVSVADNLSGQVPGSPATASNVLANDTDPNNGTLSPDSITLHPSAINVPGITYTTDAQGDTISVTVPGQGIWTLNSTNGNVTFTPAPGFTGDPVPVRYSVTDAAGLPGNTATVTIDYNVPATVSGTIYDDNNGPVGGPDGTPLPGATVRLYAADGTTVIATTTTDGSGNYSFPGQVPGNYVVGTAPSGSYRDVSSTDATPADGKTSLNLGSANVSGINFGLNQPPVTVADNLNGQTAGQPATVNNILANDTDPNGGTLVADSITLRLSGINVPGITYTTDAQGDTISVTVPGQGTWSLNSSNGNVSFFPATGFTGTPTAISYTVSDAAGLSSAPAAINIAYIVRPDLTPGVIMPSNTFVGQETKNAVLYLEEVRGGATAPGTALFRVRIPPGYVFTPYNTSLSSITPSGGGAQAVANASYVVVSQSATQITFRAAPGVVIPANGIVFLGVTFTNVTGQPQATGNITIGIISDPDSVYDSQFSNNAYSRILSID